MIIIQVPEYELTVTHGEVNKVPDRSGVYVVYGENDTPLYVGKTVNLSKRVKNHLGAEGINTRPFAHMFVKVSMFYEENPLYTDIYETYLINTLQPMINFNKTILYRQPHNLADFKRKVIETGFGKFFRCKGIANRGLRCQRTIFNSEYCHVHRDQEHKKEA